MTEEKTLFDILEDEELEEEKVNVNPFPTVTEVDLGKVKEHYKNAREQRYTSGIEETIKAEAMLWLVENNLMPAVEGKEFYNSSVMGWTCGFRFQIPLNSRAEVDEWKQALVDAGWEVADDPEQEDKDRVNRGYSQKGNYLEFKFRPGDDLLKEIQERFNFTFTYVKGYQDKPRTFEFSKYTVDLHLEFYPTETADCKITDLGEVERTRTVHVYEVTCAEGAAEMEALLNGGDDA